MLHEGSSRGLHRSKQSAWAAGAHQQAETYIVRGHVPGHGPYTVHGLHAGPVLQSAPVFLKFYLMLPVPVPVRSECVGGRRPRTVKL
eukprot:COSAG01_NODE_3047_length_6671_cov_13.818624_6_plen_87_part_00